MATDKIFVELVTKFDEANRDFKKFATTADKQLDKVNDSLKQTSLISASFIGNLAANAATGAFRILTNAASDLFNVFITEGVQAAQVQQDAIAKLNATLASTGDFTKEASKDLQDFASELQRTSVVGDETTLGLLSLAKGFGATNEQAKSLVRGALGLSIKANISLEEAVRRVGRTFSGSIEDVSKFAAGIKDLTKEELLQGKQLQILEDATRGLAEAQTQTFSGALQQLQNIFGDLQESTGNLIVDNQAFINVIKEVSKIISEITDEFKANTTLQDDIAKGFAEIVDVAVIFIDVIDVLIRRQKIMFKLLSVGAVAAVTSFKAVSLAIKGEFGQAFDLVKNNATNFIKELKEITTEETFLDKLSGGFKRVGDAAREGIGKSGKELENLRKQEDAATDAAKKLALAFTTSAKAGEQLVKGFAARDLVGVLQKNLTAVQDALTKELISRKQFNEAVMLLNQDFAKAQDEKLVKEEEARISESTKKIDALKLENELLATVEDEANVEKIAKNQKVIDDIIAQELAGTEKGLRLQIDAAKRKKEAKAKSDAEFTALQTDFLSTAASLSQSSSRELAAIGKAAAITSIAIKTPSAVGNSFEFGTRLGGPPLGFVFGAIAATAMAAQAAKVAGVPLATGGQIPSGFPNDTFPARLTSGERVLNVQENKDFTANNDNQVQLLGAILGRLDKLESTVVVNIGDREVLNSVQRSIDGGRVLDVG